LPGVYANLSALLNVAATSFKSKAEKPIAEIHHILEVVDLHPQSIFKALTITIREHGLSSRVRPKLMLSHVAATANTPQRPSIILAPGNIINLTTAISNQIYLYGTQSPIGMNVLFKSGEVVLYLASHKEINGTYAWVLSLEPYSGPPTRLTQNERSGGARK